MRARRLPTSRINHIFIEIAVVAFKQGMDGWAVGEYGKIRVLPRPPGANEVF